VDTKGVLLAESRGEPARERFALRVEGLGFKVHGSGFRVQGSGFRVQGRRATSFRDAVGKARRPKLKCFLHLYDGVWSGCFKKNQLVNFRVSRRKVDIYTAQLARALQRQRVAQSCAA
jgi:hypothetical protein